MRDSTGNGGVGVSERMLSQLLQEMDGLQARTVLVGALVAAGEDLPCKHLAD